MGTSYTAEQLEAARQALEIFAKGTSINPLSAEFPLDIAPQAATA